VLLLLPLLLLAYPGYLFASLLPHQMGLAVSLSALFGCAQHDFLLPVVFLLYLDVSGWSCLLFRLYGLGLLEVRDGCAPIEDAIDPQRQVLFIDLDSGWLCHHYLQIAIYYYPLLAVGGVPLFGVAYVGGTVVNDGEKFAKVIAGNAAISLSLKFPPKVYKQPLVFDLPQVMQSPEHLKDLSQAQEAFGFPEVLVFSVIQ
jgi:hypothetical protein